MLKFSTIKVLCKVASSKCSKNWQISDGMMGEKNKTKHKQTVIRGLMYYHPIGAETVLANS